MIVQVRGTSGSGKTTVIRRVLEQFPIEEKFYVKGRRQPLYYRLSNGVALLGHYESTCGGCDNVGSAKAVYDLVIQVSKDYDDVLCEGLLLSEDCKWTSQMDNPYPIFLTTPIDTCVDQLKSRRLEAGNTKPLKEDNTRNRVARIESARRRLLENDVPCRRLSFNQAVDRILIWMNQNAK